MENKFPQIYNPVRPHPEYAVEIFRDFVLPNEYLDKQNIYLIEDIYFILGIEELVGNWEDYTLAFHIQSNINQ